jgi:molybdenum cofactor cytidylyltransferase
MKNKLALIILAAGSASRFGSPKQLAMLNGKRLLQYAIDTGAEVLPNATYVVLGANADTIIPAVDLSKVNVVKNEQWKNGLSSSIKKVVSTVAIDYTALLFVAADQVFINSSHLKLLIDAWQQRPSCLVASTFSSEIGIPAIFPKEYCKALLNIKGDQGAKGVLNDNRKNVIEVPISEAGVDIDTPDDLLAAHRWGFAL